MGRPSWRSLTTILRGRRRRRKPRSTPTRTWNSSNSVTQTRLHLTGATHVKPTYPRNARPTYPNAPPPKSADSLTHWCVARSFTTFSGGAQAEVISLSPSPCIHTHATKSTARLPRNGARCGRLHRLHEAERERKRRTGSGRERGSDRSALKVLALVMRTASFQTEGAPEKPRGLDPTTPLQ